MNSTQGPAIRCIGVTKYYHLWRNPRDRFKALLCGAAATLCPPLKSYFRAVAQRQSEGFFALQDIDLEIARGESVGIIGKNGSGKSTLLQIIAGTLQPTTGTVQVRGRVAALLELGAGFNPEFTGRENVRLNAAILGLSPVQIEARMADVLAFADIGDFIDQPVKIYSSGMVVRLGFAVQIALEPDILIVDEALSVGDEAFQRKCFAQIEKLRQQGVTLLFVSHSSSLITSLCTRAILLSQGRKITDGSPLEAVNFYHRELYAHSNQAMKKEQQQEPVRISSPGEGAEQNTLKWETFDPDLHSQSITSLGLGQAELFDIEIQNLQGEMINNLLHGELYKVRYKVRFLNSISRLVFSVNIKTLNGFLLGSAKSHNKPHFCPHLAREGDVWDLEFSLRCIFLPGVYSIDVGLRGDCELGDHVLASALNDVLHFRVIDTGEISHDGSISFTEGITISRVAYSQKTYVSERFSILSAASYK